MLNDLATGRNEKQIFLKNNPTLAYAELVLQPQTLSYGLYRVVFTMYTISLNSTKLSNQDETFIEIIPSGLLVSSLKLSKPMYGGSIEITRGTNQSIQFNPYTFTQDIDNVAVISNLIFSYSCQIVNQSLSAKNGVSTLDSCFNSSSNSSLYLFICVTKKRCYESSKSFFNL